MIPVSKVVLSISLPLTILVSLQFNGCESGLLTKTTVEMTNKLPNNLWLGLHCKDKHDDLGPQTIQPNQKWSFRFRPSFFMPVTLYFCHFVWTGGDHWFDIYDQERDEKLGHFQSWEILESGPCRHRGDTNSSECFFWHKKDISGGRQLADGNNTIGV